jgi:hypothetical protein
MSLSLTALALAAGALAALILKAAWRANGAARPWLIVLGWGLVAVVLVGSQRAMGPAAGPFAAGGVICLAALAWVAGGVKRRGGRARTARELALEPSERPSSAWRGWLRVALAGPVGGIAAMGAGLAWAVWTPGAPQTRMVIGGVLVALLWAGAMAWTLADDKIVRAAAVLFGVAVVTFTASALRGFA